MKKTSSITKTRASRRAAPACSAVIHDKPGAFIRPDPPRRCGKPAPWHHNGIGMDLCDECHAVMSAGRGMLSDDWTHTPNMTHETEAAPVGRRSKWER